MMMGSASRHAAGLLALIALAGGVLVGALAFGDSPSADDRSSETPIGRQSGEPGWLRGPAANTADIRGPGLIRDLYLGLSCPTPNSFECDRVTIAVTLDEPARELSAWIAGRPVVMRPPGGNGPGYWEGSLQPAGLIDGPLSELAQDGVFRWVGKPPVAAAVVIETESSGDETVLGTPAGAFFSATYDNVVLHAGYG